MDKWTRIQELPLVAQLLTVAVMATLLLETPPGPVGIMESGVDHLHFVIVSHILINIKFQFVINLYIAQVIIQLKFGPTSHCILWNVS